jgi:hypothetical protein
MTSSEIELYTRTDLESARIRERGVGWAQGAAGLFLLGTLCNLSGWIPTVLVGGAAIYALNRLTRAKGPG